MTKEYSENNGEALTNQIISKLSSIYRELFDIPYFAIETLTTDKIDGIKDKLEELRIAAESAGDKSKENLLNTLSLRCYRLQTAGVIDNPEKFSTEASSLFSIIEAILLMQDSRGEILQMIKRREERF